MQLNLSVAPMLVQGNQVQLEQVFLNLFLNASDAMVDAGERRLTVTTELSSSAIVIVVRDTGSGIPDSVLERIFDPFFTTKPVGQGTGLGLSISYGIIQDHHGEIRVHQEPGGGTSFRISLPTCSQEALNRFTPDHESMVPSSYR